MTIAEIESTLNSLLTRHSNLDEGMLITLLTASGWEEKTIKEAVLLFKNKNNKLSVEETKIAPVSVLPKNEETKKNLATEGFSVVSSINTESASVVIPQEKIQDNSNISNNSVSTETPELVYYDTEGKEEDTLTTYYDDGKELPKVTEPLIIPSKIDVMPVAQVVTPPEVVPVVEEKELPVPQVSKIIELQSLIEPVVEKKVISQPPLPPENLPLKPFDSAPHVWPFSKYKEVFHSEVMPPLHPDERALVNETITQNVVNEPIKPEIKNEHHHLKVKLKRTGFDAEDEGLIFLTGMTLLIILLLLAYMYSNGRF